MRHVETRAPGRVNLIGEHTDYNGGFVLPSAIAYETRVQARERADETIRARSKFGEAGFDLASLPPERAQNWSDYVRGVLFELKDAGLPVPGADLEISGNMPIGAGLSSSASLEIAVALALLTLAGAQMNPLDLALLAQRAENEYTGTRCGVMDQVAVLFGRQGCAVYLDTRSLETELIDMPAAVCVVICDTMVKRELSKGAYNDRRRECEEAVALLWQHFPQIAQLRDVTQEQLKASRDLLTPKLYRRAMHVVTENQRVHEAATALKSQDIEHFGALMNASHESLRDLYEVSCAELDTMVELARALPGVYGARMTGGGFGGCTVNVVDGASADDFRARIARAYHRKTGIVPNVYDGTPSAGAQVLA